MNLLLFPILMVLALLGVILLFLGLRGRRINDHPVCRKCRFDLFGNPETPNCPECGRNLKPKRAVRIGVRRKRRGMIITATLLLLLGLGGGGTVGYFAVTGQAINWQELKPVWWLRMEANGAPGPGSTSDAALDELVRRHTSNELSASQIRALIDDALRHQADLNRTWQPQWGKIVEKARSDGNVNDEAWQAYAVNAVVSYAQLILRPQIRIGDPIPYRLQDVPARIGGDVHFWANQADGSMTVAGVPVKTHFGRGTAIDASGSGASSSCIVLKAGQLDQLKPGPADVEIVVDVTIKDYVGGKPTEDAIAEKQFRLQVTTELLPADQPTARILNETEMTDEIGAAVRAAITLQTPCESRQSKWYRDRGEISIDTQFSIGQTPADIAFDVIARLGEIEKKLGSITVPAGKNMGYGTGGSVPEAWSGKQIDIILRSSLDAAVRTVDCFKIWNGEIVFEDVTIEPHDKNR